MEDWELNNEQVKQIIESESSYNKIKVKMTKVVTGKPMLSIKEQVEELAFTYGIKQIQRALAEIKEEKGENY